MQQPVLPNRARVNPRTKNILGWSAVVIIALVGAVVALFMAGESVSEGHLEVGHLLQLAIILGVAALAIAVEKAGAAYALLGLWGILEFELAGAMILGFPLVAAGVLFFFGHPADRRRAYLVVAGVPVLAAVVVTVSGLLAR